MLQLGLLRWVAGYSLQAYYVYTSVDSNFDCYCLMPTLQWIVCNGAIVYNFDCYGLRVVTWTVTVWC